MTSKWSGSPMKSTGSSAMASGRRVCPSCLVPLVRIQSRQKDTFGQWFLKCPLNIKGDPSTCGFIRSEAEYEALEAHPRRCEAAGGDWCAELKDLKQELAEVKEKLDRFGAAVWKQKSEQESRKL